MNDVVGMMREERKSPKILRLKATKIKGVRPNVKIFIHEGVEDPSVYEVWLQRANFDLAYEAMHGAGKEQLLSFHRDLSVNSDPLASGIFFFIDRDFDLPTPKSESIFELHSYSIENNLCTPEVLDSLLRHEFSCLGEVAEREKIITAFKKAQDDFRSTARPINLRIFLAVRLNHKILEKPDSASDIASISLDSNPPLHFSTEEVVKLEKEIDPEIAEELMLEYDQLPHELQYRGKYELDFFRKWLRLLVADRKSCSPVKFSAAGKVVGDPSNLTMSRLALAAQLPTGFQEFTQNIKGS